MSLHAYTNIMKSSYSMIEVFKTNVQKKTHATKIINLLLQHLPDRRITFDLHDCDKVLRVEGKTFDAYRTIPLEKTSLCWQVLFAW